MADTIIPFHDTQRSSQYIRIFNFYIYVYLIIIMSMKYKNEMKMVR